jgi:hypothetical protein
MGWITRQNMNIQDERYAVVQQHLDQSLARDVLESAITGVPGLVRADSARIAQDLFGFVVENVRRDSAELFARNLQTRGYEVEAVPHSKIPKLMPAFKVQRMYATPGRFEVRELTEKIFAYPPANIQLLAAGWVLHEAQKRTREFTKSEVNWGGVVAGSMFGIPASVMNKKTVRETRTTPMHLVLRVDCFATREPFRVNGEAGPQSVLFLNDERFDANKHEETVAKLAVLHSCVGSVRVNRGLERIWDPEFVYPSEHAYEEECRWQLLQSIRASAAT